jgi:hypothetical protein
MKRRMINAHSTRKWQLQQRAQQYGDKNSQTLGAGLPLTQGWEDGYRAALKDVRKAAGRCGIPSALVKLLRPMR